MKQTKTILIAEQEAHTRNTLALVLGNVNFQVLTALNGQEAVDIVSRRHVSNHPVDLLILDSEITGYSFLRVFDALRRLQIEIPTILVTGLIDDNAQRFADGRLLVRYLRKPFQPDDVLACVSNILNLSQTQRIRRSSMNLADILHETCIQADAQVADKPQMLRTIARLAITHRLLNDRSEEDIYQGLLEREETGSTGFGDGIAIPHCALDNLSDFVVGIVTAPKGVHFDSLDGQPVKICVFIIAPTSRRNDHIRVLSGISSVLRSPANVREILDANTPAAIRTSFLRHTHIEIDEKQKGYNLFTVIVQRRDVFEDILSLLAEVPDGFVSVLEGNNAGRYLYALPLFANFWNPEKKGFHRVIQATVKKPRANETLRKMNMLLEELKISSGVLVLLQDVLYVNGTIDL